MFPVRRSSPLAVVVTMLIVASCSGTDLTKPSEGPATLAFSANLAATSAVMVVVEVSGPGITPPLVVNFDVNPVTGIASGTITVPAGSDRAVTISAYDDGTPPVKTHQGSMTGVRVVAGSNPPITLTLDPLTGEVPIDATIGGLIITVTCPACPTPSAPTVAVGASITLSAAISGASGTVTWATLDPGVAAVTGEGIVTGEAAGQTSIVATFQGAAGAALVTVTPATP